MKKALLLIFLCGSSAVLAGQVQVKGLRLWSAPDNTRIVFDISARAPHQLFTLANPHRLVIDLKNTALRTRLSQPRSNDPLIKRLRGARRNGSDLRIVLDLKTGVRPKSFFLRPNRTYGPRLVIDVQDVRHGNTPVADKPRKPLEKLRDVVIAIDAGHGGEDPGARGSRGTSEKDVVLSIAKRLARLVRRQKGMRPVLIRTGDYYIGLRERVEKARRQGADLFMSIHADAFRNRQVRGASVYALSEKGATTEAARWLANQENAADLIGGVSLEDKDDLVATVLLDLSQTATVESSLEVGEVLLSHLQPVGRLHKRRVLQAGFVVLKAPDIPSILVETAFISNPRDERLLRSSSHQQKIAQALLDGIRAYYQNKPPPGTLLAQREHVIERGDTLSAIALRYRVSLKRLRLTNGLTHDRLQIGQVLAIPSESES